MRGPGLWISYFWVFLHELYLPKSASEETGLVVGVPVSEEVKIVCVSQNPCDFLIVTRQSGKMPAHMCIHSWTPASVTDCGTL